MCVCVCVICTVLSDVGHLIVSERVRDNIPMKDLFLWLEVLYFLTMCVYVCERMCGGGGITYSIE